MSDVAVGIICIASVLIVIVLAVSARPEAADGLVKVLSALGGAAAAINPFGRTSSQIEVIPNQQTLAGSDEGPHLGSTDTA